MYISINGMYLTNNISNQYQISFITNARKIRDKFYVSKNWRLNDTCIFLYQFFRNFSRFIV